MEKLGRFAILLLLYVFSFVIAYSIIPSVVWIFGGSFLDVAQCAPYAAFCIMFINISLAIVFSECFDHNFKSKR